MIGSTTMGPLSRRPGRRARADVLRRFVSTALGILLTAAAAGVRASDYADAWGPAVGTALPVLDAADQSGKPRNLENLTGERGLLLFLSRSADW